MKFAFIKNTKDEPSTSLTMGVVGFVIVTLWLVLSIFKSIAGIEIRAFDAAAAMAYLVPILSLYGYRRKTEADTEKAQKLSQKQQDFSDK